MSSWGWGSKFLNFMAVNDFSIFGSKSSHVQVGQLERQARLKKKGGRKEGAKKIRPQKKNEKGKEGAPKS